MPHRKCINSIKNNFKQRKNTITTHKSSCLIYKLQKVYSGLTLKGSIYFKIGDNIQCKLILKVLKCTI